MTTDHKIMTVVVIGLIGFGITRVVSGEPTMAIIDFVIAALVGLTMRKEVQNG